MPRSLKKYEICVKNTVCFHLFSYMNVMRIWKGENRIIIISFDLTRCTQNFSLSHQNGLFPKLFLMINWFLNLISICIRVTGIHFVLQNSFILSYFPNFQCIFEFSALMQFFSSCAQRRFFLKNYNAVCFLIIFPLNLMHKPQWEK